MVKKIFILFSIVLLLGFAGCGGNSSKEAKELLTRILTLVGIPQEIVVNICQDENDNGFCEANELHTKITVNRGDTLKSILKKVKFDENGQYFLHNYDPSKKILMEIEDNERLKNTGQRVTLSYQPETTELSIFQSLVDNGLIKENEILQIRESHFRVKLDEVLLENLFYNQNILIRHNMSEADATIRNLEYIVEGLRDINISGDFIEKLEKCEDNSSCQRLIFQDADEQTQINPKEAKLIAETNSTEGTGDRNTILTIEEDDNSTSENNLTDENSSNPSDDSQPTENKKTEKNVADGYLIKLSSPAVASCDNGTYNSSLTVGTEGKITFEGVELDDDCIITVPSGAIIDSNNNGKIDSTDKVLNFEMKAPADASFISPLTTLLSSLRIQLGQDGGITEAELNTFKNMIKDFDPVKGLSSIIQANGIEKIKLQKLMILMEVLKKNKEGEIGWLNMSNILTTDAGESISNFYVHEGIGGGGFGFITSPATSAPKVMTPTVIKESNIIRDIMLIIGDLNPATIDIDTFLINISDGFKNIEEAIEASKKTAIMGNIFEFPVKTTADIPSVANTLSLLNDRINELNEPTSDIGYISDVSVGMNVTFDGSRSFDVDGQIVSYEWKEGNTTLSTNVSFIKNDFAVGEHNITLTVKDNDDKNSTDSVIITVSPIANSDYFITTWKTDNNGTSGDDQITIPTNPNYSYNYLVDWGDDSNSTGVTGDITHTYANVGTYTIKIYGKFPSIQFGNGNITDYLKILSIEQWGTIQWWSMNNAFSATKNLIGNANDKPNLYYVSDMSSMFFLSNFNQDIGNWNVTSVFNMFGIFSGAKDVNLAGFPPHADIPNPFNQDISSWNVSNVEDMGQMFFLATDFNQSIGDWNVSNVTYMNEMFRNANSFNQPLGDWNVSNVSDMTRMFSGANSFNQDIRDWNVSSVTYMSGMFRDANEFNQSIEEWDVSNVIDMSGMFDGVTLSTTNYSNILLKWSNQTLQLNVTFSGGNSKYSDSVANNRQSMIDNYYWDITDGGKE